MGITQLLYPGKLSPILNNSNEFLVNSPSFHKNQLNQTKFG